MHLWFQQILRKFLWGSFFFFLFLFFLECVLHPKGGKVPLCFLWASWLLFYQSWITNDLLLSEKQRKMIAFIWASVNGKFKKKFPCNSSVVICKAGLKCLLLLWVLYNSPFVSFGLSAYFNCKGSGQMPFKILSFTSNSI